MSVYPILFNRRNHKEVQNGQFETAVIRILLKESTDICIGLNADNFMIEWGDGQCDREFFHHYDSEGEYLIRIVSFSLHLLDVSKCHVIDLELQECKSLAYLKCAYNRLQVLELSDNRELVYLDCSANELPELHLNGLYSLLYLDCANNQLQALELNDCHDLVYLYCFSNRLQHVDLDGCPMVRCVDIGDNHLNNEGMDSLFCSLSDLSGQDGTLMIDRNPGCNGECRINFLHEKGWKIL